MKLCVIYNFTQKYREGIFTKIDNEYNCDWYFGNNKTDIKGFDISILRNARIVRNHFIPHTPFYYQTGIPSLSRKKDIDTFLILGDPFCLSAWLLSIRTKLFNRNKKLYFWTHGWYGKENLPRKIFKKLFFKMSDGIFLYGNYAKQLMIKEGFDEKKLHVIHNSLDYDKQLELRNSLHETDIYKKHFGNDNKNLIFIGRLTEVKRIDLLLASIANLKNKGEEYNLVLIGDGVMRKELEKMSFNLGINDNIWFYGACYDDNKNAELIYNADLCVSPGNVGLTAMHTMMFGTAVATHDTFSLQMPEYEAIKEGETGSFFKINNVESIEKCISSWFKKHANEREDVRQKCYKEIDTQWNPYFQLEVLKQVLK